MAKKTGTNAARGLARRIFSPNVLRGPAPLHPMALCLSSSANTDPAREMPAPQSWRRGGRCGTVSVVVGGHRLAAMVGGLTAPRSAMSKSANTRQRGTTTTAWQGERTWSSAATSSAHVLGYEYCIDSAGRGLLARGSPAEPAAPPSTQPSGGGGESRRRAKQRGARARCVFA